MLHSGDGSLVQTGHCRSMQTLTLETKGEWRLLQTVDGQMGRL